MGRSSHRLSLLCLAFAVAEYLFFALRHLRLPGLEYDELLYAGAALGKTDGFIAWRVDCLGTSIPLMLMSYLGALKAWIYTPIFALFGCNPVSARLPVALAGALSLAAVFAVGRLIGGSKTAAAAALLLAADPTFVFGSSRDWGPVALSLLLRVSALYLYCRWLETGSVRIAAVASFVLGLGTYDKVIFLWFVLALILAAALCHRSQCRALTTPRVLAALAASYVLGALPLIAFNLSHNFATFRGHSLAAGHWKEYLVQRWSVFWGTLDGSMVYYLMNLSSIPAAAGPGGSQPSGIADRVTEGLAWLLPIRSTFLPLLLASASVVALLAARRLHRGHWLTFCSLQILVTAGFILVTEEASGPHHTIMLYPFVQLVIALVFSEVHGAAGALSPPGRAVARTAAVLCLAATLVSQTVIAARYLSSFRINGGAGAWSDAIYDLAAYTRGNPDMRFVLMDWGFGTQLLLLAGGRIVQEEAFTEFNGVPEPERLRRLQRYLTDPRAMFVFHAPGFETYPLLEWFRQDSQGTIRLTRTFAQRNGQPIYLVYRRSPKPD
jgi:4-amino-4-deoxy-L-arabinose transferase-like glycosyltransferase